MHSIEIYRREIAANLQKLLSTHLPYHKAREVYHYALLPPGKLFRPLLARSVAIDLQNYCPLSHPYFELFVEIHHTYTLIHDDLPCMDNDSMRRGRLATHCQFGEWQALLIGDGLHALSYHALSLIKSQHLPFLLRYSTWALGPKGLIHGQYQDLSLEMSHNFAKLLTTHKLKTSRLIQVALTGPALITQSASTKTLKGLHRLGEHLGIAFQLLDDLCELGTEELAQHESQKNPFLIYQGQCGSELQYRLQKIESLLKGDKFAHTQMVIKDYLQKTNHIIIKNKQIIEGHVGTLLHPIQKTLQRLSF